MYRRGQCPHAMKLSRYLKITDTQPAQFAASLDEASEASVRKWVSGERIPRPDQMREIVRVTKGAVTPNDFYGLELTAAEDPATD